MKFSVSSSALLSLLATTGKVISNKNTLPILDYFLMELSGNELKVTTSDLPDNSFSRCCSRKAGRWSRKLSYLICYFRKRAIRKLYFANILQR